MEGRSRECGGGRGTESELELSFGGAKRGT